MMRILHLSDPHFGTERPQVLTALQALAERLAPDVVLLSGDITQRARRWQFAAARAFADTLPAPVVAVPGNHDLPLFNLWARWRNPYGNYRRAFGQRLEPVFAEPRLLVVGVNSTRAGRHKNGEVTPEQVARVSGHLAAALPGQLRIVMLHHPVRAWSQGDRKNLLIGRASAVPAWLAAGADLILGGHIHLPYVLPLAGDGSRSGWAIQAGTALSSRVRENVSNSVNLILYDAGHPRGACAVERWDHGTAGFQRVAHTDLPLARP
ncbi:metallophosphoesterase [Verticiella sediminum]|uniref:Metallophosphoesterase n=1 Tax=Verticiella sediminum TaxID=1247510 RepID=A0A556AFC7_9BURK|nr:metallophosphoesterase family protein [Verticiella sediminum]TSH91588.1 metallophosphoesterase [Verticiella sediminum]